MLEKKSSWDSHRLGKNWGVKFMERIKKILDI